MLKRFAVSLEEKLFNQFDRYARLNRGGNRSQLIRDLIRRFLLQQTWKTGKEIVVVVTLVYSHHESDVVGRLTEFQHRHQRLIVSTTHIHLDHENCLEVVIVRGKSDEVRGLTERLISMRGVKTGSVSAAGSGADIG